VYDAAARRRVDAAVYERDALAPGQSLPGPALIVEAGTTTYVTPPFSAEVDAGGALVLIRKGSKS
jgi:N-methylhydantoinase A